MRYFRQTHQNHTDAMPVERTPGTLRRKRCGRSQTKSLSPEETSGKKTQPQLQVAFEMPKKQEDLTADRDHGNGESPERKVYPPTPYIDRRQLPPRKQKHERSSPSSAAAGLVFEEEAGCPKSLIDCEEEYPLAASLNKTASPHLLDILIQDEVLEPDPELTQLQSKNRIVQPSYQSGDSAGFIDIAESHIIDDDEIMDIGREEDKLSLMHKETRHDINCSANNIAGVEDILQSDKKGIDMIVTQMLDESEAQLGEGDIDDVFRNLITSNDNGEMIAKIAQRVLNTLSTSPQQQDGTNTCPPIFINKTKSEPCVDQPNWIPSSPAEHLVESVSTETLVPDSGTAKVPVRYQDYRLTSPYSSRTSLFSSDASYDENYPGHQDQSTSQNNSMRSMHPRDSRGFPAMTSNPNFARKYGRNETELIYKETLQPTSDTYSHNSRIMGNQSPEVNDSPSKESLDLGRAYGIVNKTQVKTSAEQREALRSFFHTVRAPLPKERIPHYAKTGNFMYHLYKHGKLTDVLIRLGNSTFKAHSAILAAHSDYLACLLMNEGTPVYHLHLRDCITTTALTILLEYMYTGELRLTEDTVIEVLSATLALQMKVERDRCQQFIENIDPSYLLMVWLQAIEHDLTEDANKLLKANALHFLKVTALPSFRLLPLERLLDLLSREDLFIRSELDVARAGMTWVKHELENRRQHISVVMNTVRLKHMTLKEIHNLANETPELMKSNSRADLLNACWFLSSKHEKLPHQLGDIEVPANRIKMLELRKEAGKNVPSNSDDQLNHVTFMSSPDVALASMTKSFEKTGIDDKGTIETEAVKNFTTNSRALSTLSKPSYKELDLWAQSKPTSNIRIPSVGEQWPTLRSYIQSQKGSTLILIGGYNPSEEQEHLIGLTMLCLNKEMTSFNLRGLLPEGRSYHSAEYLDNKIYIIGGLDPRDNFKELVSPTDTLFIYDLKTAEWKEGACLQTGRSHHGSCVIGNSIYVVGGQGKNSKILSSVERFDVKTNSWSQVAPMPGGRVGSCVVAVNGRILVIDGSGKEGNEKLIQDFILSYNPAEDQWTKIRKPSTSGRCYATAAVHEDEIWLSGGLAPSKSFGQPLCCSLGLVESYNSSSNVWSSADEAMTVPRHHATSTIFNGRLIIMGGMSTMANSTTKVVEIYDIKNKRWLDASKLPRPLMGSRAVVVPPM